MKSHKIKIIPLLFAAFVISGCNENNNEIANTDNKSEDGLVFSENFNNQKDWQTSGRNNLGTLPENWDAGRTDENWHPDDGDIGSMPSMLINGNNKEQVYGETGKSLITYSESFNDTSNNGFTSDGFITKDIAPSDEVYLEFKVKFQNGWAEDNELGYIKLARIVSWDGELAGTGERHKYFNSGNNAPMYIFDWSQNTYGARHLHAFRCDAQETNYFCDNPSILDAPRQINSGGMSANFNADVEREQPSIPDLVNGGFLNYTDMHYHNQVWGDIWHTIGIHVKLNSDLGIQDGVFQFWLDGQKIVSMKQIAWIGLGGSMSAKWNSVSFGGNDSYHFNTDDKAPYSDRERWYAFDDIKVYNKLPNGL